MQSRHATPLETLELRTANLKDETKKVFHVKQNKTKICSLKLRFHSHCWESATGLEATLLESLTQTEE